MAMSNIRRPLTGTPLLAFVVCVAWETSGATQERPAAIVKYRNNTDESVQLWFQPEGADSYIRPPIAVRPKSEEVGAISPQFPGKRFIVIRDEANRDTRIGWVDLWEVAGSKKPVMLIDGVVVAETREESYTVAIPYTAERIGPDGKPYSVKVYKNETRTRTMVVKVRNLELKRLAGEK